MKDKPLLRIEIIPSDYIRAVKALNREGILYFKDIEGLNLIEKSYAKSILKNSSLISRLLDFISDEYLYYRYVVFGKHTDNIECECCRMYAREVKK